MTISLAFGGVSGLIDVSLGVGENEILAIIRPNGTGKTTHLNCTNGFHKPQKGEIDYDSQRITEGAPMGWLNMALLEPFRILSPYTGLSTQDNLMAARHRLIRQNFVMGALHLG